MQIAVGRILAAQRRLPRNVRVLSWVSLANDSASELAYPIVPLFLTITLAAPVYLIGVIEGIAEATALVFRLFSGWLSDRQGERRKPWIFSGYGLATGARALIAAAPSWGWVLTARVIDRIGKGARSTPRDALIRDSTPPELVGASFGYHRAMDTVGAVIGPLIAVGLLEVGLSLRTILWFAVVPGIATLVLLRAVREAPRAAPQSKPAVPSSEEVSVLPASFWTVLAIWVVFSLGNSSDAFLLLRSHNLGLSTVLVVLAYAIYNVVSASLSWPFGHLSDRIPRARVLAIGTVVFGLVYLGFALASRPWAVWPLLAFYGVYVAATEGVGRAWVADHVRSGSVGTAYGVFYAATAGAALIASLVAGVLWTYVSPKAPFVLGACTAGAATILLGAYAVSAGLGPRSARFLLAGIVVALALAAGIEHSRLGLLVGSSGGAEVPLAAVSRCGAAPAARIRPQLPARFPSPAGVHYTREQQAGPTRIVDGFLSIAVKGAHDAYVAAFPRSGYVVLREELDPADSEVDFSRSGIRGEVKLVQECRSRTHVRITIRPA